MTSSLTNYRIRERRVLIEMRVSRSVMSDSQSATELRITCLRLGLLDDVQSLRIFLALLLSSNFFFRYYYVQCFKIDYGSEKYRPIIFKIM